LVYRTDARRYEAGTANLAGLAGLAAALELLLEVGIANIAEELLRKRAWLVPALQGKGLTVLHADAPLCNASAILSFYRPGLDMAALQAKLLAAGVQASLRTDRQGQNYIRVSPHFYNSDAELHRLLENL
jgi:selenocysteine lyase/cysteine desulfurase